jgi:uroporphyrinogen III methyltransferase/synthase
MKTKGIVHFVGAGPGDAQLLTLRAAELLGRAEVVMHDARVSPDVLRLIPAKTRIIALPADDTSDAADHTTELARLAAAGQCIVRLHYGDPFVFGDGAAEATLLAAAGIGFEIVPGVLPFTAVPNYAGIPLTHRAHCSSFTVTDAQSRTTTDSHVDFARLARTPGTKVVLTEAGQVTPTVERLLAEGLAADTPAALVVSGTMARQRSVTGALADLPARAVAAGLAGPAVMVIGSVVSLAGKLNWFETRPLFGQRVVVTRARDQAGPLSRQLQERGAEVLEVPCIRIGPPTEHHPLVEAIAGLNAYDWVVFTSANGVTSFFSFFFKAFEDLRDLGGVRIAAVGPATAEKLTELHLKVDLMPKEYLARQIAKKLAAYESIENHRILLLRAEVATPELPQLLEDFGAIVDDVACYRTEAETDDATGAAASLVAGGADWVTFTSASTVEHFHARFDLPVLRRRFPNLKLATIGPETSQALGALGLAPAVEAKTHMIEGLVNALEPAQSRPRKA